MALANNPYNNYNTSRVMTASKADLVVMLYDAAIRFIKEICTSIDSKDFSAKCKAVDSSLAIINELKMSINYAYNEDLANNLVNIYNFSTKEITLANIKNQPGQLSTVVEILGTLKSAWEETARAEKQSVISS